MNTQKIITDYQGNKKEISCLGCAREKGEIDTGNIIKSKHFDAHQDYEIPIPGFIIISSRRHIFSFDEFTEEEQQDFTPFLSQIRKALREVLKIDTVYYFLNEKISHHFHIWLLPRYEWMTKKFGDNIESVRPIMEYARKKLKTAGNIKQVEKDIEKLKEYLKR